MPAWPKPSVTPGPQWAEMQEAFIVQYFDTESGAWKPLVIPASALKDGEITDAKIADTAAIALTKLATGILPSGIKIVDANVNAGISQSKIANLVADLGALGTRLTDVESVLPAKVTNPMIDSGDLIVGGANGVPARLAKGAEDEVLSVIAGALGYRLIPTASLADGAVTTPKLADGAVTTPKLVNQAVTADKLAVLPGCRLTKSGTQSIPQSTWTAITWDQEDYDTDGMHDLVTNPSRITIQRAGVYVVGFVCVWDANQTGARGLAIALNGSRLVREWISMFPANPDGFVIVPPRRYAAGDYLEAMVWQNSGANRNVEASVTSEAVSAFSAQYLGPSS